MCPCSIGLHTRISCTHARPYTHTHTHCVDRYVPACVHASAGWGLGKVSSASDHGSWFDRTSRCWPRTSGHSSTTHWLLTDQSPLTNGWLANSGWPLTCTRCDQLTMQWLTTHWMPIFCPLLQSTLTDKSNDHWLLLIDHLLTNQWLQGNY